MAGDPGFYRPVLACHFGVMGGIPMKAFVWHTQRGTLADQSKLGVGEEATYRPIFGTRWPDYGFDE